MPTPAIVAAPAPATASASSYSAPTLRADATPSLIALFNSARANAGLPPLEANGALTNAAAGYARVMAESDWFAHTGPDGSSSFDRIVAAGYNYSYAVEILYMGPVSFTYAQIVEMWLNSSKHRSVILSPYPSEVGAGCYILGEMQWCVGEFGDR